MAKEKKATLEDTYRSLATCDEIIKNTETDRKEILKVVFALWTEKLRKAKIVGKVIMHNGHYFKVKKIAYNDDEILITGEMFDIDNYGVYHYEQEAIFDTIEELNAIKIVPEEKLLKLIEKEHNTLMKFFKKK